VRKALGPIWAVAAKDVLLELRNKEIVLAVLVFSLIVLVLFNFAINLSPSNAQSVGPGVLWVAIVFAAVTGLDRSFILERDQQALDGLLLAPVSRDVVLIGKALGNFLFITVAEAFVVPAFAALFGVDILQPEIAAVAVLATLGLATVGTLFAGVAVNTRAREVMLPLLFLPLVTPLLIAAVQATVEIAQGGGWAEASKWIGVEAVFDLVFVGVSLLVFQFVLEE